MQVFPIHKFRNNFPKTPPHLLSIVHMSRQNAGPQKNPTIPNGKKLFIVAFFVTTIAPIDIFPNVRPQFPQHALILEICST